MMARGYEQGFGYLRGVAVDQHIVARGRQDDLQQVIAAHKELLGIGLDEGTAMVVTGDHAEFIGRGKAFVHNGHDENDAGHPYLTLLPGDEYDLAARRLTARAADGGPFRTDEGNVILDCRFAGIADATALNAAINAIPSVVEHGLFINMASVALVAGAAGVTTMVRAKER